MACDIHKSATVQVNLHLTDLNARCILHWLVFFDWHGHSELHKAQLWQIRPFTSTFWKSEYGHRTLKVYVVMLPLTIITICEIHQALTGSNCISVLF